MAIEEVRTPTASGNAEAGIDNRAGVQHRDPRQGGRRDSQWYVLIAKPHHNTLQLANFLLQSPRQSSTSPTSPMVCHSSIALHSTQTNSNTAH
jgi:hypothetical protein